MLFLYKPGFAVFITALSVFFLFLPSPGEGSSTAPLNPAFLKEQAGLSCLASSGMSKKVFAPIGYGRPAAKRPSPLNLDHLSPGGLSAGTFSAGKTDAARFPVRFDLREQGKLSQIHDQAPFGTCWTFAAMAAVESNLLPGDPRDFSEWHLAYWAYNENPQGFPPFTVYGEVGLFDQGGDDWRAVAVLARGTGPVKESDLPYNGPLPSANPGLKREKLLTGALYLPYPAADIWRNGYPLFVISELKSALMSYGALSIGMMATPDMADPAGGEFWNPAASAFYYNGERGANHAVNVVGWDDTFPKENFVARPENDGAWIVRNSWGERFGEKGYFYISYEDTSLDSGIVYFTSQPYDYTIINQYDPLGWVTSFSPLPVPEAGTAAWMANVFRAGESQLLKAVSLYAAAYGTEYEIAVASLRGTTPAEKSSVLLRQSGILQKPGYHTVHLDSPVFIPSGTRFSVEVKLATPGYPYPLPVEEPVAGYSDGASALPGQSFYSSDGISWKDLADEKPDANFCVKAMGIPGNPGGGCSSTAFPLSGMLLLPLLLLGRKKRF